MTARSALTTVIVTGIAFACVGAIIGATIGTFAPGYYRTVFRHADLTNFNPMQVGIGLGVTQGFSAGIAISLAVLALLAWRDARAARPKTENDAPISAHPSGSWTVRTVWRVATIVSLLLLAAIMFVLGGLVAQEQLYQSLTAQKLDKIARILESREFKGIRADSSSVAQVYLTGIVKDRDTRETLKHQLVLTFGMEEANAMISGVDTEK